MYYEEITIDHLDKLAELYVETFNSEPWNDEWTVWYCTTSFDPSIIFSIYLKTQKKHDICYHASLPWKTIRYILYIQEMFNSSYFFIEDINEYPLLLADNLPIFNQICVTILISQTCHKWSFFLNFIRWNHTF